MNEKSTASEPPAVDDDIVGSNVDVELLVVIHQFLAIAKIALAWENTPGWCGRYASVHQDHTEE